MKLPIEPPFPPMEASTVDQIPDGEDWQYEPKWDGFRCLAFRDGGEVYLQSKACKPLARYFPDVVAAVEALPAKKFVLDGELVIPVGGVLDFDELLLRIHPAESRVRKLAEAHPATFIAFDILADSGRGSLLGKPVEERRERLEAFAAANLSGDVAPASSGSDVRPSPATRDLREARRWYEKLEGIDGVMAKRLGEPYASGERSAVVKVKRLRTADCVVGGFRYGKKGLGSLLLGLYDDAGALNHVGFCSAIPGAEKKDALARVEKLRGGPGFTGRAPGGPSRWQKEEKEWHPLRHELVLEVEYDHVSGGRFRHGTRFVRWRPDKAPEQCTEEQIRRKGAGALGLLE